jgi:serine/threonine protein kinase
MSDLIGQIIGNYCVETLLGVGGMGKVFRGRHIHIDRPAAIKVLHETMALDPGFRARFLLEAKSIAALQHPNIVEIYDFGEHNGRFYLVLELLAHGSLRGLLQRHAQSQTPWSPAVGLELVGQAAEALAYAHGQGVVHRDIKPDNMLLKPTSNAAHGSSYTLKLSDFGLARLAEGSLMTATGTAMGTPAYMSPEQCLGQPLDGRSDIYALGVVLYEVTTGYLPFAVKTLGEAAYKHVHVPPPPPRSVRPEIPAALEAIILRCLAKKPEERFACAEELASAIQQALRDPALSLNTTTVMVQQQQTPQSPGAGLQLPGTAVQAVPPSHTPPAFDSLSAGVAPRIQVLNAQQQVVKVVELSGVGVTVGRLPTSAIVLDAEGVSRNHMRVDWDGNQATITDLGSTNGTLLAGMRLPPHTAQPWPWKQVAHVGPFWLRLEPPAAQTVAQQMTNDSLLHALMSGERTVASRQTALFPHTPPMHTIGSRIAVSVDQHELTLTPDQAAVIQITLANVGLTVDHLTLTVEGVPAGWVHGPTEAVQLNPGAQSTVALSVLAPRISESRAGEYPVKIRARSRTVPTESSTATAIWTVLPFNESALTLTPMRAGGREQASYTATLCNNGNASATYRFSASDDEQALAFHFEPETAQLEPGQSVPLGVRVRGRRRLIGSPLTHPFTIRAEAARGEAAQSAAQFIHQALVPIWAPPLAIAVLLALCFGLYSLLTQRPAFEQIATFEPANPQPGQPVTIRWRAVRADTIALQLEGQPAITGINPDTGEYVFAQGFNGPAQVKIIASNRFGSAEDNVSIGVLAPSPTPTTVPGAPSIAFSVSADEITVGQVVTLTWVVTDAQSVEIAQFGTVDARGQRQDQPRETTDYRLIAVGKNGQPVTSVQKVFVLAPTPTTQPTPTGQAGGQVGVAPTTPPPAAPTTPVPPVVPTTPVLPSATPTLEPTATPTLEPTTTPTLAPTATPTLEPTLAISPEDCLPYDPSRLRIEDEGFNGWLLTDERSRMLMLDDKDDAENALRLAQRHNRHCFIGRGNNRTNRIDYIVEYWEGDSGQTTTLTNEDCIAYDVAQLQIIDEGANGWLLTDGRSRMLILDNQMDAENALKLARRHTQHCFIGRDNTRPNRKSYIVEYWR